MWNALASSQQALEKSSLLFDPRLYMVVMLLGQQITRKLVRVTPANLLTSVLSTLNI